MIVMIIQMIPVMRMFFKLTLALPKLIARKKTRSTPLLPHHLSGDTAILQMEKRIQDKVEAEAEKRRRKEEWEEKCIQKQREEERKIQRQKEQEERRIRKQEEKEAREERKLQKQKQGAGCPQQQRSGRRKTPKQTAEQQSNYTCPACGIDESDSGDALWFHVTFGTMQNAPMYLLMIIAVSAPWTGTVERV